MPSKLILIIGSFFLLPFSGCSSPQENNSKVKVEINKPLQILQDTMFSKFKIDTSLSFPDFETMGKYRMSLDQAFFDYSRQLLKLKPNDKQLKYKVDSFNYYNTDLFAYMVFKKLRTAEKIQKNLFYVGFNIDLSKLISIEQRIDMFNSFPDKIRTSPQGKKLLEEIEKNKKRTEQIRLNTTKLTDPDLMVKTMDGQTVQFNNLLSSGYDQYLIIFGASWCSPCRYENQLLKTWLNKVDTTMIKIIAISIDTDKTKWLKAVKDDNCPWLQTIAVNSMEGALAKYFKLSGVPVNVLLDKNKNIVTSEINIERLKDKICNK